MSLFHRSVVSPVRWYAILCSAVGLLGTVVPARAQVSRDGNALQLVRVDGQKGGERQYQYLLRGPARAGAHSELLLWLDQPVGHPPVAAGRARSLGGRLLFDATIEDEGAPWRHPELGIVTPANWSAAILPDGALHWGATRAQGLRTYGVPAGKSLTGFVLSSNAVPALRVYRVVPERRFEPETQMARPGWDSTWVLQEGLVLAPGWAPRLVHWGFLYDQARLACERRYMDESQCGRAYRWLEQFQGAHLRRNDRAYLAAIIGMEREVAADRALHPWVRTVVEGALSAMRQNPPSKLPALDRDNLVLGPRANAPR